MAKHNDKQNELRHVVETTVAQALQAQTPQVETQIVQEGVDAMPGPAAEAAAPTRENASGLVHAVASIHAGSTQKEILRALLEAGSAYCSRIALFVVKAGAASGWQARGFGDD